MTLPSDSRIIKNMTLPTLLAEYLHITFKSENVENAADLITENGLQFPLATSPILYPCVDSVKLISKKSDKHIIELILDLKDVSHEYHPGDTLAIIPSNNSLEVEEIVNILGLRDKLDSLCELSVINKDSNGKVKGNARTLPPHLPVLSTLRRIFEKCVEIRGPPKKLFIRALAEYTSDQIEKNRLLELCCKEGSAEYEKEFSLLTENKIGPGFGLLEFLKKFPSCIPPVNVILQHLPRLKPRPYSIASSPLVSDRIRILFSVYKQKECKGVCTAWLENLLPPPSLEDQFNSLSLDGTASVVPSFFRKSMGFRLPDDSFTPIILIGPGTGVSPFIGFLEHRAALKNFDESKILGEAWLFYGCQNPEIDFIYEDKLKGFVEDGVLNELLLSFSRFSGTYEGWSGTKYVQDNISIMGEKFVEQLLDKEAVLYVSGDAKNMFKDIMDVINATIQKHKGINHSDASKIIKDLISKKKYLQDIWY